MQKSAAQVLGIAQPFKETLSAADVATAFRRGIAEAGGKPTVLIGSDGGDGLLDALEPYLTRRTTHTAVGPLLAPLEVPVGWLEPTCAVIESRRVCGLDLVDARSRDPGVLSTRGLGELIRAVADAGAEVVYVGLGGSATVDGGVGMASAWGWRAFDAGGGELPAVGDGLTDLAHLEAGKRPRARLVGLFDVRHRLLGPEGARRFAAQKGATAEQAVRLAGGLERLARVTDRWGGTAAAAAVGAGAAGGLGFGLVVFGGARLEAGAPWVLHGIEFPKALRAADLVITGEGGFDDTSCKGKLTGAVLDAAHEAGVPAGLVAPTAIDVPENVTVESGPGQWTGDLLAEHVARLVGRALRLPGA